MFKTIHLYHFTDMPKDEDDEEEVQEAEGQEINDEPSTSGSSKSKEVPLEDDNNYDGIPKSKNKVSKSGFKNYIKLETGGKYCHT